MKLTKTNNYENRKEKVSYEDNYAVAPFDAHGD